MSVKELQTFNDEVFGSMRTVAIDGEPWFIGKDMKFSPDKQRSA